jgi:hypothetical protein
MFVVIGTSFWGNPRSNSPWKQAILEIGLTLFLDSCSLHAHTNTHANHSYLVRDSVACANQNCVPEIALFLNAENPLQESPKTNGTGPNLQNWNCPKKTRKFFLFFPVGSSTTSQQMKWNLWKKHKRNPDKKKNAEIKRQERPQQQPGGDNNGPAAPS